MKLMKKIKEWQRENVIDDVIAQRIVEYESSHSSSIALWAFGGMGAFAIIVGLISVIAANWSQVPDWMKLGVDLVACLAIAAALYWNVTRHDGHKEKLWVREMLVVLYYGFVLASMALIGQTYQLGGTVDRLLLVWTLVTIPLVLLARGRLIALLWFTATATTYLLNMNELYDLVKHRTGFDSQFIEPFVVSLYVLGPLVFLLISRVPWLVREREQVAEHMSRYSWLLIVIMGLLSQFLWYGNIGKRGIIDDLVAICFVATAAMIYFIPKLYASEARDTHKAMRVVLAVVFALGASAVLYRHRFELAGALTNLAFLFVLAWAAIKIRSIYLFNILTAFICLRIIIIYFEVFGSMLETGIGLIVGGVLTLLISWWWFKRSNRLALRLGMAGSE